MGMKMRMNIILKDSQIVVGWSVFIFIPLLILILNRSYRVLCTFGVHARRLQKL
jgi:hypothetical protein